VDDVPAVFESGAGKIIASGRSSEVREVQLGSGPGARTVFIKKYWVSQWTQLWKGMFRGTFFGRSKVRREFLNLARLRFWDFDAPVPVAYGEERVAGWLTRSFLISEGVPAATTLQVFIREHASTSPGQEERAWRRELIGNLAEYTRRLHQHRFVHHDYFWRNILLSGSGLRHFFLIDAHKGRRWFPGEQPWARARDLAALDAPAPVFFRRTERLRFLLLYLGKRRLDPRVKALVRRILRLAEPTRAKQVLRACAGGVTSFVYAGTGLG
jgi:tRNA A-37 threonylcarbamoyl transferase component Bud32